MLYLFGLNLASNTKHGWPHWLRVTTISLKLILQNVPLQSYPQVPLIFGFMFCFVFWGGVPVLLLRAHYSQSSRETTTCTPLCESALKKTSISSSISCANSRRSDMSPGFEIWFLSAIFSATELNFNNTEEIQDLNLHSKDGLFRRENLSTVPSTSF